MKDAARLSPPWIPFDMGPDPRRETRLPTVAALCSSYFSRSHSQHTVDRFLMGYEYAGQYRYPPFRVVSLYVDRPSHEEELSALRAEQFDLQVRRRLRCVEFRPFRPVADPAPVQFPLRVRPAPGREAFEKGQQPLARDQAADRDQADHAVRAG